GSYLARIGKGIMNATHRKEIIIYTITFGTILVLSILFPNTLRFKYEFEEGKIWRYEDLISPFDFGIQKPREELVKEYGRIDSLFPNYYRKDPNKIDAVVLSFTNDFLKTISGQTDQGIQAVSSNQQIYLDYGTGLLHKYYDMGIVDRDSLTSDKDFSQMLLLDGDEIKEVKPLDVTQVTDLIRNDLASSKIPQVSFLFPLLDRHIHPNIYYDAELTNKLLTAEKSKIAVTRGKVSRGELIIEKDAVVTHEAALMLESYRNAYEHQVAQNKSPWFVWSGYFLLMVILFGVFTFYYWQWLDDGEHSVRTHIFIQLGFLVFVFISYLVEKNGTLSIYIIPFCIAPIVLKAFFNDKVAFSAYVVMILAVALLFSFGFEFVLLQISAGLVAIVSNKVTRYWTPFFRSILMIALTYSLGYLSLTMIKEGTLTSVTWSDYSWFFINIVLVMLAYPLVPLLERVFGFTTAISLAELGDLNRPLLKDLSFKAPGTFQHSLQVANIAEAAAERIGADSLLLRVSALYHDIGKMEDPEVFIENQSEFNPHKELTPEESARRIINHVTAGAAMAKKARLPKPVIGLIRSHHGTTRVEYFYKASEAASSGEVDATTFTYPGPKPVTKEEVILMLADSIEAACKSLKHPTESDINQMVDKIFTTKNNTNQFSEAKITFAEMELIRASFKKVLKGIYHIRVEYPEEKTPATT
ncbi:MAG: HDIG domain-containing protein, partial [Saprospiraceae bacterium]|nr:HDIG domain-containing protein [Saprospiraceae bacterium]